MLVDLEEKPAGPVATITSEDVKRLRKGLKGGQRKKREAPEAAKPKEDNPASDVIRPAATNRALVAFIERIERVEEERASLGSDIKEIYGELKSAGFDAKIVRKLISLRRMDEQERIQADQLLSTYMAACGMARQGSLEL